VGTRKKGWGEDLETQKNKDEAEERDRKKGRVRNRQKETQNCGDYINEFYIPTRQKVD